MRVLLWLSALANVGLGIALFWMRASCEADLRKMVDITLNAEETHMKVHALALDAILDPDSESTEEAKAVLGAHLKAWETGKEARQRIR